MLEVVGIQGGVQVMHAGFGMDEPGPITRSESGLGRDMDIVIAALDGRQVDYIALDAGSTDPGPYFLGSGTTTTQRAGIKMSLSAIIPVAVARRIPLIIGSCAMSGTTSGLTLFTDIVREISDEKNIHFNLGLIDSEVSKDLVKEKLRAGKVRPMPRVDELTEAEIDRSTHIVAMQGTEPVIDVLDRGADVVLSGRISDSAIFAAVPIMRGVPLAQAWHMAKVIDHGHTNLEPVPGVQTTVYGIASTDHFRVEATNPDGRVSSLRAAHTTVYENSSPFQMFEPPGLLDISEARFEQRTPRSVSVTGSEFVERAYSVKLEGAKLVGYRTITIAGVRDPDLIGQIDPYLDRCRDLVASHAAAQGISGDSYRLVFRVYGKDAVMGRWDTPATTTPHEIGIIGEVVAPTQELANAVGNMVHLYLQHTNYPGRLHTTGNMAFPYSPSDISCGPVYEFNVWHVMELDHPMESCTTQLLRI